ncbi:unnamed protein product [Ixodes persulcatus]
MTDYQHFPDLSSLINFFPSGNSTLTIVHVNIRSIRKYWDEFQIITQNVKHIVDVFVLTEINVHDIFQGPFTLSGYQSFFNTRDSCRGGGIAIYVQDKWYCTELKLSFTQAEYLTIKICNSYITVSLLALYRPPSSNVLKFLDELNISLTNFGPNDKICLVGDFNIDILNSTRSSVCDYLTLLSNHGLAPLIQAPTREESLNKKLVFSCIDHINVRSSGVSAKSSVISQKLADHYFVACQIDGGILSKQDKERPRQITIIDSHKFDRLIASYDWNGLISTNDSLTAYSELLDAFDYCTEQSTKIITTKKRRQQHVWLTSDVLSAIKLKDILWARLRRSPNNPQVKLQYISQRNRVTAVIRSAKRKHYHSKFIDARSDTAKTWSLVNEVKGGNARRTIDEVIKKNFHSNMTLVANSFNHSFASVSGVSYHGNITTDNQEKSCLNTAYLPNMTEKIYIRCYLASGLKKPLA